MYLKVYPAWKDVQGPIWQNCAIALAYGLIAVVGLCFNLGLCYVTLRERQSFSFHGIILIIIFFLFLEELNFNFFQFFYF
jgi:hypothetical protein